MRYLLLLLLLNQTVFAQTEDPLPAAVLVELLGGQEQVTLIHKELLDTMTMDNPEFTQHRELIASWSSQHITWDTIEVRLTAMYSQYFTDEELEQMIRFYRSETGQKVMRLTPTLLRATRTIGQDLAKENKASLQQMLQATE